MTELKKKEQTLGISFLAERGPQPHHLLVAKVLAIAA
jgi:hypothetical protein